jgi:hypothetical protein
MPWSPGFWAPTQWDKPSAWWHQENPSLLEQDEQVIPEHAMFNHLQEDMELRDGQASCTADRVKRQTLQQMLVQAPIADSNGWQGDILG